MHILRYRALFGVRLIRTLFHIMDGKDASKISKVWFDTHMFLHMHKSPTCSVMLVNSREDIEFAMQVLSMRCLPNWMLQMWNGPRNDDAKDMMHMYNYTHNVLLRQWYMWEKGFIHKGKKELDVAALLSTSLSSLSADARRGVSS